MHPTQPHCCHHYHTAPIQETMSATAESQESASSSSSSDCCTVCCPTAFGATLLGLTVLALGTPAPRVNGYGWEIPCGYAVQFEDHGTNTEVLANIIYPGCKESHLELLEFAHPKSQVYNSRFAESPLIAITTRQMDEPFAFPSLVHEIQQGETTHCKLNPITIECTEEESRDQSATVCRNRMTGRATQFSSAYTGVMATHIPCESREIQNAFRTVVKLDKEHAEKELAKCQYPKNPFQKLQCLIKGAKQKQD